jgi:hypothetical protein
MTITKAGRSGAHEGREFDALISFVGAPDGCRHAQLSSNFGGRSAADAARLLSLCQGGCDVCDLRLAALHDCSDMAQAALMAIRDVGGEGIAQAKLLYLLREVRCPCPVLPRDCDHTTLNTRRCHQHAHLPLPMFSCLDDPVSAAAAC